MASSHTIVDQRPANDENLMDILVACAESLDAEIEAVMAELKRWGGDAPVDVKEATIEGTEGEHTIYRCVIGRPLTPPEHTGVEVSLGTQRVRGYVETIEDRGAALIIALEKPLRGEVVGATISFDATYVLRMMRDRIMDQTVERLEHKPAVLRVLGLAPVRISDSKVTHRSIKARGLVKEQVRAMERAAGSDLSLVFGPPGTGKTRTLGALVAELAESRNLRVLVTAHTNTALDTAMASVVASLPTEWVDECMIVRSGRITREFEHLGIGYEEVADRATRKVADKFKEQLDRLEARADEVLPEGVMSYLSLRKALRKAKKKGPRSIRDRMTELLGRISAQPTRVQEREEVSELWDEVARLQEKLASAAAEMEQSARVVGATFSKLAVEPGAFNSYDAVIMDEASMASLPQVLIASLHAKGLVAVFGDPCQLSPIVQSRSQTAVRMLGRNIYQHLGLADPAIDDPRRPILLTQFRMRPEIRQLVSEIFYAGRLKDAPSVLEREPLEGSSLVLVDTTHMGVYSEKSGTSRVNEGHAEIVAEIARQIGDRGERDIGIITPFKSQMKLINKALRTIMPYFFSVGGFVRTIHRSQGGEKKVIILDTVDAPPNMSAFLDASWNQDLPNLLCVAISRAEDRLFIVAHTQGFRSKYGRRGALIMRILETAFRRGEYIAPRRTSDGDPLANLLGARGEQEAAPEESAPVDTATTTAE